MENILASQINYDVFDDVFAQNKDCIVSVLDFGQHVKSKIPNLSSRICYLNNLENNSFSFCDELSNKLVYKIAKALAIAIDNNDVQEIKLIKTQYSHTKEFSKAKDFLNRECKSVWNVFENKNKKMNVPKQALKVLGITNNPSLDFLLGNSIRYFEKNNSNTTVDIIESILKNPNLDYTIQDIYDYLKFMYVNKNCKYNLTTLAYFLKQYNYDKKTLTPVGADKKAIKAIIKTFSFNEKIKYFVKNIF